MTRFWSKRPTTSSRFFTEDWFSNNVPVWERLLAAFKDRPGVAALEIGSFEGRSACWLLEHVLTGSGARLDCIDIFANTVAALPGAPDTHLERFRANIAPWRRRVRLHVGPSAEVLRRLTGPYDVVYVDGWHSAPAVLADAVLAWPLLKRGGVLIFDDYGWEVRPKPLDRPKIGIDAFLAAFAAEYELLHRAYQVAVRKTAG